MSELQPIQTPSSDRMREASRVLADAAASGGTLDLSRGKPAAAQLDLANDILTDPVWARTGGADCRTYGDPHGIPEMLAFWEEVTGIPRGRIRTGGNSSLRMMYDAMARAVMFGMPDSPCPWYEVHDRKFLCPAPGYDRHFRITETMGFTLIPIRMTDEGPDMDEVAGWVSDPTVKGIWCVPKYHNPTGAVYSRETIRRLATMDTAAPDFTVFFDNAYAVHGFCGAGEPVPDILRMADEAGHPNRVLYFASTSKITFPGGGVAMFAAGEQNLAYADRYLSAQSIGPDRLNQLRTVRHIERCGGIRPLMARHAAIIRPKFDRLFATLHRNLDGTGYARWTEPEGGYFSSLDTLPGKARRVWELCRSAGVILTPPGATFPYGKDPADTNLRLAPTCATAEEVEAAARILCAAILVASGEA